ncbi:MAG TPA: hypothetical protein DD640_03890, partial [Clostridiales bacterium]|nr:hypothetical protein [Clostridiales bacterium]
VLTAFKNDDPNGNGQNDEIPMLGYVPQGGTSNSAVIILTALGMNTSSTTNFFTKDDGSINLGAMDDNYIHYLEYMKLLLAEGLLDQDHYTMTSEEFNAKLAQNTVGLSPMSAPFVYMPDPAQYKQYQALTPLTSAYNSTKVWPVNSNIFQGSFAISYDTEYPEACIRMANVFFEEGINLLAFVGPLTSDTLEPQYPVDGWEPTKCAIVDGAWSFTTPDGTDLWTYLNAKAGLAVQVGPMYTQAEADAIMGGSVPLPDNETSWRSSLIKNVAPYQKLWLPTLFLDADELERANELKTPIVDYITTMEAKFIMGEESLDNIDAFYAQLKTLGIEEYVQIYQTAYDAYLANQ